LDKIDRLRTDLIKSQEKEYPLLPVSDGTSSRIYMLGSPTEFATKIDGDLQFYSGIGYVSMGILISEIGKTLALIESYPAECILMQPTNLVIKTLTVNTAESMLLEAKLLESTVFNEIANICHLSEDFLNYLYTLEQADWAPVDIDNSNISIIENSFSMQDVQIPHGENTATINGSIGVINNGSGTDPVPVTAIVKIYRIGIAFDQEDFPIMFTRSNTYDLYPGESKTLNLHPISVFDPVVFNSNCYNAVAYIIAGPSIISKEIGPANDGFYVTHYSWPRQCEIESVGSGSLETWEEWIQTFSPIIEPFQEIYNSDVMLDFPCSDLDLHIYDSYGNHVGLNYSTGLVDLEIPGALYNGPTSNPEIIRLPNPTGQTYSAKVVAIETHSKEPFAVTLSNVPLKDTQLGISPSCIQGNFFIDEVSHSPIAVSIMETSGQQGLTGISVTSTDLSGPNGNVITSENVTFDLPSTEVQAGGTINCMINLNISPGLSEGEYTGEVIFNSSTNSVAVPITVNLISFGDEECIVTIYPSSTNVSSGETLQFSATTFCDGNTVTGSYDWAVSGSCGGSIDNTGLYTAPSSGTGSCTDTIIVTDTANGNIIDSAIVKIEYEYISMVVSPNPMMRSRWIMLPNLMIIQGEGTSFAAFSSNVMVDPSTSVILPLPALVLSPEVILQFIFVNPSWLAGAEDETITVAVETGAEYLTDDCLITVLPFPLDEEKYFGDLSVINTLFLQ